MSGFKLHSKLRLLISSNVSDPIHFFETQILLDDLIAEGGRLAQSEVIENFGDGKIHSVKLHYGVEIGSHVKGSRPHLHAIYNVRHNSRVRLNLPYIRGVVEELLGTGCFVSVKFLKSDDHFIPYMNKGAEDDTDFV